MFVFGHPVPLNSIDNFLNLLRNFDENVGELMLIYREKAYLLHGYGWSLILISSN
jgi:hypothetical protein